MKSKRSVGGLIGALLIALLTWWVYGDDGAPEEVPPTDAPASTIETDITEPFGDGDTTTSVPDTTGDTPTETTVLDESSASESLDSTTTVVSGVDPESGLEWVAVSELPPEAETTLGLIDTDGPYPYDQDGSTFENREGILPDQPIGYYGEFTVDTPGEDDRGARRIVVGDGGEFYYTEDHYESFLRISR